MKRNRWMILILVVVIGFLYFKVSDSERTISAACFTNEIQTVKKEKKYYLEINPTKERVRCTKEEYDRVKNGDEKGVAAMCKIIEDLIDSEKKEIAKYFGLTLEQVEELERSQYVQL